MDFGFIISEKNSHISGLSNTWGDKAFVRVYIKLHKGAQIDNLFLTAISNHISRYSKNTDKLMFQPLADIHLYSDYQTDFFDKNPGNIKYVWIFSLLAFIIILMVSLNYSTLSIARASERSVEIGIRKINGGSRISIFRQFMAESIFQTFAATIIALLVVWFLLSLFNSLLGKELIFHLTLRLIINLFLLTSFVGVIAGLYPSLYLSSFHPIGIFRRGTITGSRSSFIRLLVTIQFTFAAHTLPSTHPKLQKSLPAFPIWT
jgi:putative ABC transport system permease protein